MAWREGGRTGWKCCCCPLPLVGGVRLAGLAMGLAVADVLLMPSSSQPASTRAGNNQHGHHDTDSKQGRQTGVSAFTDWLSSEREQPENAIHA